MRSSVAAVSSGSRVTTFLLICAAMLLARAVQAAERPNIVLIDVQGLPASMTGFGGNAAVRTPNLDALAAQSVQFTRCYVPTPQGAPSQAVLLTGQYPQSNGITSDMAVASKGLDAFTSRIKRAGYVCGFVGQWRLAAAGQWPHVGLGMTDYVALSDGDCPWQSCKGWVQGENKPITEFLTDWECNRAIDFVQKAEKAPFFLWLAMRAPDFPRSYPPGDEASYPPASLQLPPAADMKNWPARLSQSIMVERFHNSGEKLRQDRSRYFASLTRLDTALGRLLKKLDELKIADDTIVVFTSDHGIALGEHGLCGFGPAFFDEMIRVPLLVRLPRGSVPATHAAGETQPATSTQATSRPTRNAAGGPDRPQSFRSEATDGAKVDRIVSRVGLAPTLCELAGLSPGYSVQGQSFAPLLLDPSAQTGADEAFFAFFGEAEKGRSSGQLNVRGVVLRDYKYLDYVGDTGMLFDLKRDPQETTNLINEKMYAGVVRVLTERVRQWRKQTHDPVAPQ